MGYDDVVALCTGQGSDDVVALCTGQEFDGVPLSVTSQCITFSEFRVGRSGEHCRAANEFYSFC